MSDLTAKNPGQEAADYIQQAHNCRLEIHRLNQKIIQDEKKLALYLVDLNAAVAADKTLSNSDKRRAKLLELKANDKTVVELERCIESAKAEVELHRIHTQYSVDMIKLNIALIGRETATTSGQHGGCVVQQWPTEDG
ncbi:MAG: hypothetical protein AAGI45_23235 [Cyanobacteria bacterium P01_H01_bin.26]